MKKDPADKKPAKKTPAKKTSKSPKKQTSDKPVSTQGGKRSVKEAKAKQEMSAAEAEARYGTWAVLAGKQSEEEARAMVDELWLLLNDLEEYRKLNPIANIMGIHEGRRPEKVHLIFNGEAVDKVLSREWHPTQDWRHNPDGTLDYWLEIAPCWQLKRWVLGFLGGVTVMSPPGFREIVIDHWRKVVEVYSKDPDV
jgi:hypothetical protein